MSATPIKDAYIQATGPVTIKQVSIPTGWDGRVELGFWLGFGLIVGGCFAVGLLSLANQALHAMGLFS
jgi:hypothetical protein